MTKNEKRSVIGIVFSEGRDAVLLIKRRDVPVWALPGGGIDPQETPEGAVVREIYEETGLTTRITRHVALYTPINRLANPTFVFECKLASGCLSIGNETREVAFFPLDRLPSSLFFIHKEWIVDALKNDPKPIYKPLSQVTYINLLLYFLRHPMQVIRLALSRFGVPYNQ